MDTKTKATIYRNIWHDTLLILFWGINLFLIISELIPIFKTNKMTGFKLVIEESEKIIARQF